MAKDPAILWYWNDWHGKTITLSRYLKGCYMDLLHAQFNNGRLSLEEIKTVLGSDFGPAWPTISKKFTVDDTGKYFNERIETEKENRAKFREKQSKNGKKGGRPKNPNKTQALGQTQPIIEDEIEIEKEISVFVLEAAERNQFSHTGKRNTEFIKEQWEIFLLERRNDAPAKKMENKGRMGEYFLNWIRNKFPKKQEDGKRKQGTSEEQLDGLTKF